MRKERSVEEHARVLNEQQSLEAARRKQAKQEQVGKLADGVLTAIHAAAESGLTPREIDQAIRDAIQDWRGADV